MKKTLSFALFFLILSGLTAQPGGSDLFSAARIQHGLRSKRISSYIEHGHNNNLVLDLRSVAYWYQSEAVAVPSIPTKDEDKLMPPITPVEVHKWRDAWRQSKGNGKSLWGNEK